MAFGTEPLQSWCSWNYADNISASQSRGIRERRTGSPATEGFTTHTSFPWEPPQSIESTISFCPKFRFPVKDQDQASCEEKDCGDGCRLPSFPFSLLLRRLFELVQVAGLQGAAARGHQCQLGICVGQSCPRSRAVQFTAAAALGRGAPCHSKLSSAGAQTLRGNRGQRREKGPACDNHAHTQHESRLLRCPPLPAPAQPPSFLLSAFGWAEGLKVRAPRAGLARPFLLPWPRAAGVAPRAFLETKLRFASPAV